MTAFSYARARSECDLPTAFDGARRSDAQIGFSPGRRSRNLHPTAVNHFAESGTNALWRVIQCTPRPSLGSTTEANDPASDHMPGTRPFPGPKARERVAEVGGSTGTSDLSAQKTRPTPRRLWPESRRIAFATATGAPGKAVKRSGGGKLRPIGGPGNRSGSRIVLRYLAA